jgi:hypothetical protein
MSLNCSINKPNPSAFIYARTNLSRPRLGEKTHSLYLVGSVTQLGLAFLQFFLQAPCQLILMA